MTVPVGQLGNGGGLAHAVDPHQQHHPGAGAPLRLGGAREQGHHLRLEGGLEPFHLRQFPAAQFLLQGLDQKEAGLHPQIGGNQQFLQLFQELGVHDLAAPEQPVQAAAQGLPGPAAAVPAGAGTCWGDPLPQLPRLIPDPRPSGFPEPPPPPRGLEAALLLRARGRLRWPAPFPAPAGVGVPAGAPGPARPGRPRSRFSLLNQRRGLLLPVPVFILALAAKPAAHRYDVVILEKSAIRRKVRLMRTSRARRLRRRLASSAITSTFSKKASTGPLSLARARQTPG